MKTMTSMTDTSWRQPMWTALMSRLPASITINISTQSYVVKDNSLQYIYSDDIDADGVDELIAEVSRELTPGCRDEFKAMLSMNTLRRRWNEGRKGYTLLSQMGGRELVTIRTDVIFGQGVNDMIFELRFDVFDLNALLPERVYGMSAHGE